MIDNIKKLIRENIGNPVMISLAGSHVYGTNDINSNVDYFALIKDGAEQAIDMQYEFKKDEDDIFYLNINAIKDLIGCSTILFVCNIGNVLYAKEPLKSFIDNNLVDLMNISPYNTYMTSIELIQNDLQYKRYSRILTINDILKNFYYNNDFSKCLPVSEYCKNQIKYLRSGNQFTENEIMNEINFICSEEMRNYMQTFNPNYKLHNEFINIIDNL